MTATTVLTSIKWSYVKEGLKHELSLIPLPDNAGRNCRIQYEVNGEIQFIVETKLSEEFSKSIMDQSQSVIELTMQMAKGL